MQEYKRKQEAKAAPVERNEKYLRDFPFDKAVDHVLSVHSSLCQPSRVPAAAAAAVELGTRVIKELGRKHSAGAAIAAFEWLVQHIGGDRHTAGPLYEAAVTACALNFALPPALQLFERMQAAGVGAGVRLYNMIIAACCHAGIIEVAIEVTYDC